MQTLPAIVDLPSSLTREISRVISLWAVFELILNQTTYALLSVGDKGGRIAVREPRTHERIDMIKLLVQLRAVTLKNPRWKEFREDTETAIQQRDLLAHGVWVKNKRTNQPNLRVTRGGWQPTKKMRGKVDRRIMPEARDVDINDCRIVRENMRGLLEHATGLCDEIKAALQSSPGKCP